MKSIFISSTFRDMNFERDVLNRRIAPKINHKLRKYNQSIRVLDLRWGVDTSDMEEKEASERVLTACMNAIENCKPYFVILIGDRYGYIPSGSDISVTHMEILRGALEQVEKDHIYIYFRYADYTNVPEEFKATYIETEKSACEHLKKLKDTLKTEMPDQCRSYTAHWDKKKQCLVSEDFERILLSDLEADLLDDTQNIYYHSELHRQLAENNQILAENCSFAQYDKAQLDTVIQTNLNFNRPWALIGPAGNGKSVYLSLLCSTLRANGHKAQILFCGDNAFSASSRNAAEMVLYTLLDAAEKDYNYKKFSEMSYGELIQHIINTRELVKRKVYLFFDAVDKCTFDMLNFVFWCCSFLSEHVQIVISSRKTQEIIDHRESLNISQIEYTVDDYRLMAQLFLKRFEKQLNPSCIELALTKIQTPLQLKLLLMRLLRLNANDFAAIQSSGGGIEQINEYLKKFIEESPTEISGLISLYLKELLDDGANPEFYLHILGILAFCENGLLEQDIQALFELSKQKWTELEYIDFLERYAFLIRIRENGRLDLSHDIIRQTLRQLLDTTKETTCYMLAIYFLNREPQDRISIRTFFDAAFIGQHPDPIIQFAQKHNAQQNFTSLNELSAEIRHSVQCLFFKDCGKFLLNVAARCKNMNELSAIYTMISSSLLTINNYYESEIILQSAYIVATVGIPFLKLLGNDMLLMEIKDYQKFLLNNNILKEDIEEFLSFCKEKIDDGDNNMNIDKINESTEMLLEQLHKTDGTEKVIIWNNLFEIAQQMKDDAQQAIIAEHILKQLQMAAAQGLFENDNYVKQITLGELYSCFSIVYKTLNNWDESLLYGRKSRDIYHNLYETTPSADVFRKLCNKVSNIANIIEYRAMKEKTNPILWENTKQAYEEAYAMEVKGIAIGMSERRMLKAASVVLSLGTALINTNRHEDGMQKYKEGIAIIIDFAKNNQNMDLYVELCNHLIECIYQLLQCNKIDVAYDLSKELKKYISLIIHSGEKEFIDKLNKICNSLFGYINTKLADLNDVKKAQEHSLVCRISGELYETILPIASAMDKSNLITVKCNMCSFLMFVQLDYEQAYLEYKHLLELTIHEDLLLPDENGKYIDAVNSRLIDAYVRIIICLEKMNRNEEIKVWVNEAEKWATYFSEHIESAQGDVPKVLLKMYNSLKRYGSSPSLAFLMMAFNAMSEDNYDKQAHPETVMSILLSFNEIKSEN